MRVEKQGLGGNSKSTETRRRRRTSSSSRRTYEMDGEAVSRHSHVLEWAWDHTTSSTMSEAAQRRWSTGSPEQTPATAMEHTGDDSKRHSPVRRTMARPFLAISLATLILPTTMAVPPPRPSRSQDDDSEVAWRRMQKTRIPPRDRRRSSDGTPNPYPHFTLLPAPTPAPPPPPKRYVVPPTDADDATGSSSTSLPIACSSISVVAETTLPYLLTQDSDGTWQKQDGWVLFGRGIQASSSLIATTTAATTAMATALAASSSASFDVTQSLPKGWGSTSNRSSLYAVPLIVVSSVILALLITAFVSFIVISRVNRSKKLGRRKRQAEKEQQAKLRAAGLLPPDHNSPRPSLDGDGASVLSGKSGRGRRQSRGAGLGGPRILEWRKGLRRRRKGGKREKVEQEVELEDMSLGEAAGSSETRMETEVEVVASASAITTTVEEAQESSIMVASGSAESPPDATGMANAAPTDPSATSPVPPVLNLTRNEIEQAEADAEEHATAPPMITGGSMGYLPAYRPASIYSPPPPNSEDRLSGVRREPSLAPYEASAGASGDAHGEKVGTAGYYPAPTTIEQEEAVAVASGSHPMEAEDHATALPAFGHVATDDKRVLERLMRNASSVPGSTEETVSSSAPVVDVDEDGFERLEGDHDGPSAPPTLDPVAGLPAPPQPVSQVSASALHLLNAADMPNITPLDSPYDYEGTSQPDFRGVQFEAPSAPVFDDEEEGESRRASQIEDQHRSV